MRHWLFLIALLGPANQGGGQSSSPAPATAGATSAPFARGEVLRYSANWPSGLSLGEAELKVGPGEPGWSFELSLDAGLPGFEIRDRYRSQSDGQFCAISLEKDFIHGSRKSKEKVSYDRPARLAKRQTIGGGASEVAIPDCVKDALSFLYFTRRELANGRVPAAQTLNFGAPYQVSVAYTDSPQIEIGGTRQAADRLTVSLRGPASSHTIQIFFARDAARTPLLIRAPLPLGTFSLELTR